MSVLMHGEIHRGLERHQQSIYQPHIAGVKENGQGRICIGRFHHVILSLWNTNWEEMSAISKDIGSYVLQPFYVHN